MEKNLTEILLYIELNVVGIFVLFILLFNLRLKNKKASTFDQQLFIAIMVLIALMLVLDTMMYLFDGQTFPSAKVFNYISTTLYYIVQPLVCVAWALYADYKLNENLERCKKLSIAAMVVIALNTVLSFVSMKYNIYFVINAENVYSRGEFVWVSIFLSYIFFIYSFILVATAKRNKKYKMTILLFPLFTLVASVLQIMHYGLTLIWTSAVVCCVMVFINIQNTQIDTDGLTGLFNRRHLEKYLDAKSRNKRLNTFVIMLDVNNLKKINDTLGHIKGDEALITVADVLKSSIGNKNCLAARYGGDEFCVAGLADTEESVKIIVEDITKTFSSYIRERKLDYDLSACIGHALWDKQNEKEFDASKLISLADKKMYQNKTKAEV